MVLFAGSGAAQSAPAKTSFTADLSYVTASGNTDFATLSIGDRIVYSRSGWTFTQLGGFVRGTTKDSVTARSFRASLRGDRAIIVGLSLFAGAATESNKFAGFDSRTDELAGVNWKVIHSPSDSLAFDAGANYTQQQNVNGTEVNYGSWRTAEMYKHMFSTKAYFLQLAEYVPSVGDKQGYRFNSESAIVAPVLAHIGIKANYALRYVSKPPAGFGTTDRVLTMGVQVTY